MYKLKTLCVAAVLAATATAISGCSSIDPDAAAKNAAVPGSAFSNTVARVGLPGNIPGVPASNGNAARWSQEDIDQLTYLDASCQTQLAPQLPGKAQAMLKEGGFGAVADGLGEGLFSLPFPGAAFGPYAEGGAAVGFLNGLNTGRIRQDQAEKSAVAMCVMQLVSMAQNRYHIMQGTALVPWFGNGDVRLVPAKDQASRAQLPYVPVTSNASVLPMQ